MDPALSQLLAQQARALLGAAGARAGASYLAQTGILGWPVLGPITSPFCERRAWEACHPGIDIVVPSGTPILAAGDGTVVHAGWKGGYGNAVFLARLFQWAGPKLTPPPPQPWPQVWTPPHCVTGPMLTPPPPQP